jgi:drug/metabolite transporter (DMT)-like permease
MNTTQRSQRLGILAGFSTGIFWGLPFFVPKFLPHYSYSEIAFGRMFFFGITGLLYLKPVLRILRSATPKALIQMVWLSASGFWLYSALLFLGVARTDGVIGSLILGLLPVTIPLFAKKSQAFSKKVLFGFSLILLGLFSLFCLPLLIKGNAEIHFDWIGVGILFSCLALWTSFAISNSVFLKKNPQFPGKDMASVMGILSLICVVLLFAPTQDWGEFIRRPDFGIYLLCSVGLGLGSSWLANWLWNICSFHCPPSISGPLIASETIFGLLYSFLWEQRLPSSHEAAAIVFILIGVFVAVRGQLTNTQRE